MSRARLALRRGFTLAEMLVAMSVTLLVFAITLPFVRAQTRSLGSTAGRLDADQVARYAMRAVEQDLRRASGEFGQPMVVAAGPMLLAFNANIRRGDTTDLAAFDEEIVGAAAGDAWPLARAAALPTTARVYPTQDYVAATGDSSRTETVSYYLLADSSGAADLFDLYRQLNDQPPLRLISGLFLPDSQEFFTYFRLVNRQLQAIPDDSIIFWDAPRMAEIRTVGLRASGRYVNRFDGSEFVRRIETRVTLPPRREAATAGCNATPAAPSAGLSLTLGGTPYGVRTGWNGVTGDTGEPDDARAYLLERRRGGGAWEQAAVISATGASSYTWFDQMVGDLASRAYRVSVVGCDGSVSAPRSLGTVTP